ncbi:hypothetical protein EVAR_86264_1 [Eumeta japonica]|uniref:Uncharacterized protein n=1 Tax=Eumeta variegata TaxID=151549 RepID=A0A4C1UCN9_EUMVA|nr:hypothetical protein EVAR_86264_1 [Eumeta japonica]
MCPKFRLRGHEINVFGLKSADHAVNYSDAGSRFCSRRQFWFTIGSRHRLIGSCEVPPPHSSRDLEITRSRERDRDLKSKTVPEPEGTRIKSRNEIKIDSYTDCLRLNDQQPVITVGAILAIKFPRFWHLLALH